MKKAESKPATVNATLRKVKSIFSEGALQHYRKVGIYTINPFQRDQPVPEESPPFQGYSMDKIGSLYTDARAELKGSDDDAFILFQLGLFAGLRQQEALWARWEDLRDTGMYVRSDSVHRTKSKKGRFVYLPPEIVEEIRNLRNSLHPLMVPPRKLDARRGEGERRGRAVAKRLAQWLLGQGVIDAHKPIHELRKIYGSLIATEHGLYAAKELLGHSTIAVTEKTYAAFLKRASVNLEAFANS